MANFRGSTSDFINFLTMKNSNYWRNIAGLFIILPQFIHGSMYHITDQEWEWRDGSAEGGQYSTQIIDSDPIKTQQYPGSRQGATVWNSGKELWLFGGKGPNGRSGAINDLWKMENETMKWSLVEFDVGSPKPEGRMLASSCGVPGLFFFIFGGMDDNAHFGDAWVFYMKKQEWVPLINQSRIVPPRGAAAYWCLKDRLIIYGGRNVKGDILSDMWSLSLKDLQWTLLNNPSPSPGSRDGGATWSAKNETMNLYLFGGNSLETRDSHLSKGFMSDLWQFTVETNSWQLLHGDSVRHKPGVYGSLGIPDQSNIPGSRKHSATWIDTHGDLWMFGGGGQDKETKTTPSQSGKLLSDLWVFDIQQRVWVWLGGPDIGEQEAFYGKLRSKSHQHIPGPRWQAVTWSHKNTFYMFGGEGHDKNNQDSILNDLWLLTFNIPPVGHKNDPNGFLGIGQSLSPGALLGVCFAGACLIAILFVLLMYAKKCWHAPRHKPVLYNIRYSSLIDDEQFEDDFTDDEQDELFEQNKWRQNGKSSNTMR
ncbi:unnamed protein product [Owenia fusiformis]|uniref:Uncharacterized protein n=1 Tax=Owenia fusiformis TaxID=6347 RepID=A0A8J1UPM4_OWEFU|nr:unnamed protein product [Owenia fusiformis]